MLLYTSTKQSHAYQHTSTHKYPRVYLPLGRTNVAIAAGNFPEEAADSLGDICVLICVLICVSLSDIFVDFYVVCGYVSPRGSGR